MNDLTPIREADALVEHFAPMRAVHLKKPFNKLMGKIPPDTLSVPSMMSAAERRFLYGLAQQHYSGKGLIVDAGLFLGASTRCFGEGLKANTSAKLPRKKPIISFERGLINPGMPAFFKRNKVEFEGEVGESFESLLRENVAPVSDVVELRVGDIMETGKVDAPIEILYLDVLKSAEITSFVYKNYVQKLIPGVSIVLQQDYFFDGLPFIKTYQENFARCFEYVGEICSMAVFRCIAPVPAVADDLEKTLSDEAQLRLASIALHRSVDPCRRFMMAVSKLRLIRKLHGLAPARAYFKFIEGEYPEVIDLADTHGRLRDIWRTAQQVAKVSEMDD